MGLEIDSLAAAIGVSVQNKQFIAGAKNLPRKILLIGQAESTSSIAENTPRQIVNAEEVGAIAGYGHMLHRLAIQAFKGSNNIETWVVAQKDTGTSATALIDFAGSLANENGNIYLYIANELVRISILKDDDADTIASKALVIINGIRDLPVIAEAGTGTTDIRLNSKTYGEDWGQGITLKLNLKGEELPLGVVVALPGGERLTGGSQTVNMQAALDSLGIDDDANELFFTDVVHGYGRSQVDVITDIAEYVGLGNDFTGLYSKLVGRPFRCLSGDIVPDTAGFTALKIFTDTYKLDRANGIIAAPGSASHPSEIAAQAIGHMARINNIRAAQNYIDIVLIGIDPGLSEDRWTRNYDNRDEAVKKGISPTRYKNGNLVLQNVVSFYHPDEVPLESNGYLSMRNISITQNILNTIKNVFEQEKWKGFSIVADLAVVKVNVDKAKARDIATVIDELVNIARIFEERAWLYSAKFTIDKLKEPDSVTIRPGGTGFDNKFRAIYSGEGLVLDTLVEFDINVIAAL